MLANKYAPQSWGDFIGQEKTVAKIRRVIGRDDFKGGAFLLVGPSGTGKTSAANLIAKTLGCTDLAITDLDGDKCSVDAVRELEQSLAHGVLGSDWRAVIVNECHCCTPRAVQAWLTLLDPVPKRTVIIFTTTEQVKDLFGEFQSPFASRCMCYEFSSYGLADAFAERAQAIAKAEGLDGAPIQKYKRLVQANNNNFRAVLNQIAAGEMMVED